MTQTTKHTQEPKGYTFDAARFIEREKSILAEQRNLRSERAALRAEVARLREALQRLDDVVNEPNGHPDGWNAALTAASDQARAALGGGE